MAHFAKMDGDKVTDVIVVNNSDLDNLPFPQSEPVGIGYLHEVFHNNDAWLQTSYNASFRKNYAGIGYSYDAGLDAFIAPQPYPSWSLNTDTCQWIPPVPYPDTLGVYIWDENTQTWVER